MDALRKVSRCCFGEFLSEIGYVLIVVIGARDVNKLLGLLGNGRNYFGMSMACSEYCYASVEIEKCIAIDVFDYRTAAALDDKWISARIAGRDVLLVFS